MNLGHFEADVVLPTERILLEEFRDGRIWPQRLDQFDLAVGRVDETHPHALGGQVERVPVRLGAEQIAVQLEAPLDRGRRNADMVEAAEFHSIHRHAELVSASIRETCAALHEYGS